MPVPRIPRLPPDLCKLWAGSGRRKRLPPLLKTTSLGAAPQEGRALQRYRGKDRVRDSLSSGCEMKKGRTEGLEMTKSKEAVEGREENLGEMRWRAQCPDKTGKTDQGGSLGGWDGSNEEYGQGEGTRRGYSVEGMLKGVTETRPDKRLGMHFPGRARLTGVRPGVLGARGIRDQVRAAKAHELGAAPQRLPQRSALLTEAPLALPEAGQG